MSLQDESVMCVPYKKQRNNNSLLTCKPHFKVHEAWHTISTTCNMVMCSSDEEAFGQAWDLFALLYKEKTYCYAIYQKDMVSLLLTWLP